MHQVNGNYLDKTGTALREKKGGFGEEEMKGLPKVWLRGVESGRFHHEIFEK